MIYQESFADYGVCSCGAVTLYEKGGNAYSCSMKNRRRFLPGLDLRRLHKLTDSYCCDHCVNHYGLDLCACGSGKLFWECDNGFPECGQPMQELGGRTRVIAKDAWIF